MKYFSGLYYKAFFILFFVITLQTGYTSNTTSIYWNISLFEFYMNLEPEYNTSHQTNDSLSQRDYSKIISEALEYQLIADSLSRLAKKKRSQLHNIKDPHIRIEVISDISRLDKESNEYQEKADEKYNISLGYINRNNNSDTLKEKIRLVTEVNGIKVYQYVPPGIKNNASDSLLSFTDGKRANLYAGQSEPIRIDEFEILEVSRYNDQNPIPSGIKFTVGLVFRIQSGVYSKLIPNDTYGGLAPVSFESVKGKFKYFIGVFYSTKNANKALIKIRDYGFPDAFIVPFYNGKVITIEKAKEIEYSQIKL